MKVSVVLATWNRLDVLKQVIEALFEQDLDKSEYEILISDDGSTDGTKEYLPEAANHSPVPFTYNLQDHAGPAKARNWGIFNAQGEYVVFTDDDCIAPKDWLTRIIDAFERYPEVVGVSGYQEADDETLAKNIYAQYEKYANMGDYMEDQQKEHVGGREFLGGATNNVAYKKSVLVKVKGFDESFPYPAAEDADLKERITDLGYLLVHVPIKVTHKHPYSFKRLMSQAYVRGVGSRHFNQKHGLPSSSFRFFLSVGKVTVRLLSLLFTRYYYLYPIVLAYQFQFMRGVLAYNQVMQASES